MLCELAYKIITHTKSVLCVSSQHRNRYTEKLAEVYDVTIFCVMGVIIIEFTVTFIKASYDSF